MTFVAPPLTISRDHMISNYGPDGPEGALIYDQTAKVLKICDGTSWQTITGGGGSSQWTDGAGGTIYYNGGNVGIGSANPGARLTIVPSTVATTSIAGNSIAYGSLVMPTSGRSAYTVQGTNSYLTTDDNAAFGFVHPWDATDAIAGYKVFRITTGTEIGASGTAATAMTDRFYVRKDGGAFFGGNVGIGTTNPTSLLTVGAAMTTTNLTPIAALNTTGSKPVVIGDSATGNGIMIGYGGNRIQARTAATMGTNGNLILNDIGGNVGIGTTAPSATLHVKPATEATGTANLVGYFDHMSSNGGGSGIIRLNSNAYTTDIEQNAGGTGPFRYGTYVDTNIVNGYTGAAGPYGNINLVTGNAVRLAVMGGTKAGKVGVGTVGPNGKLQVVTSNDTTPNTVSAWDDRHFVVGRDADTGGIGMSYDSTSGYGVINALSPTVAWRNLVLQSGGGNVGIGDSSPDAILDVYGVTNGNIYVDSGDGYPGIYWRDDDANKWRLYNHLGAGDRLYLADSDGTSTVHMAQNATSWTAGSDVRLKKNVRGYTVLDRIGQFRAVTFDWKQTGKHDFGVIAQEVYEAYPEVVEKGSGDANEDIKDGQDPRAWGVNYDRIGVLALQGVKELSQAARDREQTLNETLADHRSEITRLKEENDSLRSRLHRLEVLLSDRTAP